MARALQQVHGRFIWNLNTTAGWCSPRPECSGIPFGAGLSIIVTGLENSGTTVLSQLVMSSPHIFGGFECGLLLACSPREFSHVAPFHSWLPQLWRLHGADAVEQVNGAACHQHAYGALLHRSLCMQRTGATSLLDKTPSYIYILYDVMRRTPGVPVVVAQKSRAAQLRSWAKRGVHGASASKRYDAGVAALKRAAAAFPERLRIVDAHLLEDCPATRSGNASDVSAEGCAAANTTMASLYRWLSSFNPNPERSAAWHAEYLTLAPYRAKNLLCAAKLPTKLRGKAELIF
mmetsp:Transcript_23519/g.75309  ORF Transcript_23519/g.75309 Transcript_23519/m.75309 type:complete len:290 (+) Transcript_23519:699-1568(+)